MVDIYKLKFTRLQEEILRLLYLKTGSVINARQISMILNVSQTAVSNALPLLKKEELIKVTKDSYSGRLAIELNEENRKILQLKRADNLKKIYESGFVNYIEDEFPGGLIILFGSYSYGEDTINSDIDIAIIGRKEKKIDLKEYKKILGREIRLNFYDNLEKINKNLKSNIFNGIILVGRINL